MGNVSGRGDGEGTSGMYSYGEGSEQKPSDSAQSGSSLLQEPLVQSSPLGPWVPQSNLFHVPVVSSCSNS